MGDFFSSFGANWKTTLGALMVAAGYAVSLAVDPSIGEALKVGGTALIGLSARDYNVTSEQSGVKDPEIITIIKPPEILVERPSKSRRSHHE